jgi:hypothetical protein
VVAGKGDGLLAVCGGQLSGDWLDRKKFSKDSALVYVPCKECS